MAHREPKEFLPVTDRVSIFLRGKTWYVNYQQDGKQVRTSLKTTSKKEAERKAGEIDRKLTRGENPQAAPRVELTVVLESFIKDVEYRESATGTITLYKRWCDRIRKSAAESGVRFIGQLSPQFADAFRDHYTVGRASVTLYSGMRLLRSLSLFAFRRQLCDIDSLAHYKVPKARPQPQPCWSPAEADQIVAAATPEFQPYLLFLRETGCRTNEGRFLTWNDVHFGGNGQAAYIHICAKEGWRPKSGDERKVPMTARLAAMLRSLPRHGKWVFGHKNKHGEWEQMRDQPSLTHLKAVAKRLGLEGFRHTFRHTYISQALMSGLPESVVREWAGHIDPRILKLYTHVAPEVSQQYLKLFESGPRGGSGDPTATAQ